MRFRILGPLDVRGTDGRPVPVGAPKQRSILAVLLLHANQWVSAYRLQDALWPDQPPQSAAGILRTYVFRLRHALQLGQPDRLPWLATQPGGYRLAMAPGDLDLLVFEDLAVRGRRALESGDAVRADGLLSDALALWRGDPAGNIALDEDTTAALTGLLERRLATEEAWIDARLALGNDAGLIARLKTRIAEQPFRERLCQQLMLAMYRAGRKAEALEAFQALRRHMLAELGIEPSAPARELQRQILAADPALDSLARHGVAPLPVIPRQLPPGITCFTGRRAHLKRLHAAMTGNRGDAVVIAISGMAGAGKTTLAVHWAHQVEDRFSDGQLHADLRGYSGDRPLDCLDALQRFLRALGTAPGQVPGDLDEAAAQYRSLLAGKRMLILLDNAASASQVRPLLPGAQGCLVLVTSRSRLPGLISKDGAVWLSAEPFTESESVTLLRKVLGSQRVSAGQAAAVRIAGRCACLPLALRVAAERAAHRPWLSLDRLADELTSERDRLDALTLGDDEAATIRSVFSWSYRALKPDAARMFRLLGLHAGPDISVPAAAALTGVSTGEAARLLDSLAEVHLLAEASGRYQFHDLLRGYAAERAGTDEDTADRTAATRRILAWYLHTYYGADRLLAPARHLVPLDPPPAGCAPLAFTTYQQALEWCDAERVNLVAAVHLAAGTGQEDIACLLAIAMRVFFHLRGHRRDGIACASMGADAARRTGDKHREAQALNALGSAYRSDYRFADAIRYYRRALRIRREIGDRQGEGATLNNLGGSSYEHGQAGQALGYLRQALLIARELDDRYGEGITLENLGEAHFELGQTAAALDCYQQALAVTREIGDRPGEGIALKNLGDAHAKLEQTAAANERYREALVVLRSAGDQQREAQTLLTLGDLLRDGGDTREARRCWQQSLDIFAGLGDPREAGVRARLEGSA
jgi:DNA-binding SARP family transcriptional activator/tetratricopeptide (TPR) repeat protein